MPQDANLTARHPVAGGRTVHQPQRGVLPYETTPRRISTAPRPIGISPQRAPIAPHYSGRGGGGFTREALGHALAVLNGSENIYGKKTPPTLRLGGQTIRPGPSSLQQLSGITGAQDIRKLAHPVRLIQQERRKTPQQRAHDAMMLQLFGSGAGIDAPALADTSASLARGFHKGTDQLLRDERIPKKLRVAVAAASLPIPGPIDNAAQLALYGYIALRHRQSGLDALRVGRDVFAASQVKKSAEREGKAFSYALGGAPRLNDQMRENLLRLRDAKPGKAEEMVARSKLGIAHHGTPWPTVTGKLMPHAAADAEPRFLHMTANPQEALSYARTKAERLRALKAIEGYDALIAGKGHPGLPGSVAQVMINRLHDAWNTSKPNKFRSDITLDDLVHPETGEQLIQPRVHDLFVDSRNPIHLDDAPNPGAVESAIDRLQNEYRWANNAANAPVLGQKLSLIPDALRHAKTYDELLALIRNFLNPQHTLAPYSHQNILENVLTRDIGADAVISGKQHILTPSTMNVWPASVVGEAEGTLKMRQAAAEALRVDEANARKNGLQQKTLDPQVALKIIEGIKAGKIGPLRERVLLKHVLESPPGSIKQRFRGTTHNYRRESAKRWEPYSLHGPGAYSTTNPAVASDYATSGATLSGGGGGANQVRLVTTVPGKGGLLDLDKDVSREQLDKIINAVVDQNIAESKRHGFQPATRAHQLNELEQAIRGENLDQQVSGAWLRDHLDMRIGPESTARAFRKAGINVMQHTGGRVIGGFGDHEVSIALKPSRAQPTVRVRRVMQAYHQAVKALERAVGQNPHIAEHKAEYLREYAKQYMKDIEGRTKHLGAWGGEAMPITNEEKRNALNTVMLYPEIRKHFGNEGVALFAQGLHSGLIKPDEIQKIATNIFRDNPPIPVNRLSTPADVAQRLVDSQRKAMMDSLRLVLKERQGNKLDFLYPGGGFPY